MHKIVSFPLNQTKSCARTQTDRDLKLQEGAMFAIRNLIEKNDTNTTQRLSKLSDMGVVDKLDAYMNMPRDTRPPEEYDVLRYISFP